MRGLNALCGLAANLHFLGGRVRLEETHVGLHCWSCINCYNPPPSFVKIRIPLMNEIVRAGTRQIWETSSVTLSSGLLLSLFGSKCQGWQFCVILVTIDDEYLCEDSIWVLTGLGSILSHEIRGKVGRLKTPASRTCWGLAEALIDVCPSFCDEIPAQRATLMSNSL